MTRRAFISSMFAIPASGLVARMAAASEFNRFKAAQVTVGGGLPVRPNAALVLAQEVRLRTSVDVRLDRVVVPLASRTVFDHPFLLWFGDGPFPDLDAQEVANLTTFLQAGGFMLVDNAGEGAGLTGFDRQVRAQLRRAFPGRDLDDVPENHVLRRSFYKVTQVCGRRAINPYLEGIFLDERLALVYSQNDLAGAWSRDGFGNWEFEAVPGGPHQREAAIRMGVNLVMYALLLDYKDEQAHVDYLLKRRRLRPDDGK